MQQLGTSTTVEEIYKYNLSLTVSKFKSSRIDPFLRNQNVFASSEVFVPSRIARYVKAVWQLWQQIRLLQLYLALQTKCALTVDEGIEHFDDRLHSSKRLLHMRDPSQPAYLMDENEMTSWQSLLTGTLQQWNFAFVDATQNIIVLSFDTFFPGIGIVIRGQLKD